MSWTDCVSCSNDGASDWTVVDGVWTCNDCGKAMTVTEVAAYHAQLDISPRLSPGVGG